MTPILMLYFLVNFFYTSPWWFWRSIFGSVRFASFTWVEAKNDINLNTLTCLFSVRALRLGCLIHITLPISDQPQDAAHKLGEVLEEKVQLRQVAGGAREGGSLRSSVVDRDKDINLNIVSWVQTDLAYFCF